MQIVPEIARLCEDEDFAGQAIVSADLREFKHTQTDRAKEVTVAFLDFLTPSRQHLWSLLCLLKVRTEPIFFAQITDYLLV